MVVATAFIIWSVLKIVTGSPSPVVVVLSGSMEPAFFRGDLLFLTLSDAPFEVGEIVVYNLAGRDIPIVHRILEVREEANGAVRLLTKGDNNPGNDRGLYNPEQLWLERQDIQGRVRGFLPYVGYLTIMMNDFPWFKYALLGSIGLVVILNREG